MCHIQNPLVTGFWSFLRKFIDDIKLGGAVDSFEGGWGLAKKSGQFRKHGNYWQYEA